MSEPSSSSGLDRRSFVKTLSAAGIGAATVTEPALASSLGVIERAGIARRRYAIIGAGSRHQMYQNAIERTYAQHAELVAICDTNPGRIEEARRLSATNNAAPPTGYIAADFDRMLREQRPEILIVTTVDATHDEYIVRAMNAGVDVITEKPMTTTAEKAQRILDAKRRTGRTIRVTFNYRYSPPRTQVKDLLMSGEIGDLRSVDFHWMLNTHHGADYFRRWHGEKKNSGGLMVHKATHHFDLVNWWLSAVPVTVFATGKREFYTPQMARRFGLASHHDRCLTCPEKLRCSFYLDLAAAPGLKSLYLDHEQHDGYFRDQCVWNPRIDIEDTMNVLVTYDTGVTMAYSLNAFNSWEGYTIVFNGTLGRLEHTVVEQVYMSGVNAVQGGIDANNITTRVIPIRGPARRVEPWTGEGGHGGGDTVMLDEIFLPSTPADKYKRASDERGGAASILVGIAANRCFQTGQPVKISDLVSGLTRPEFAPMPSTTARIPMPPRINATRPGA